MALRSRVVLCCGILTLLTAPGACTLAQGEEAALSELPFSNLAVDLPIPPDARKLEFDATFDGIEFISRSSIRALEVFYRNELFRRGWQEEPESLDRDEDGMELTFTHGDAEIELTLYQRSNGKVEVDLETEEIDFQGTDDPAALAARGIPQPRAYLFIQSELPFPKNIQRLEYEDDGCMFYAPIDIAAAFDYYGKLIRSKGFRESRRPIIDPDRRYTEFKKGSIEFSVNIFTDPVGSRIILEYEDPRTAPKAPRLPEGQLVAALLNAAGPVGAMPGKEAETLDQAEAAPVMTRISVAGNRGAATVQCGDKRHVFKHVAAYKTKDRADYATSIVFSSKPIPFNQMQQKAIEADDFSFGELYEWNMPDFLVLTIGQYTSFSFTVPGIGIGRGIEAPENNLMEAEGRVSGAFRMPAEEILNRQFSFTAEVDAVVITPNTRISAKPDPVAESSNPLFADSPVPMPENVEDLSRSGSRFRKEYLATAPQGFARTLAFYTQTPPARGWRAKDLSESQAGKLVYVNDRQEMQITLKPQGSSTAITAVVKETAQAKADGVLPAAGQGRLMLANAHSQQVVFTIGQTDYPLRAGQGAKDPKQGLNYTVPPGKYKVIIKIPGQSPQTEVLNIQPDNAWGVIALPTGGYMPLELY